MRRGQSGSFFSSSESDLIVDFETILKTNIIENFLETYLMKVFSLSVVNIFSFNAFMQLISFLLLGFKFS